MYRPQHLLPRLSMFLIVAAIAAACSSTAPSPESSQESGSDSESSSSPSDDSTSSEDVATDSPADPSGPIYESLALDSPEQAVETLISAYDDRDFLRAWFVLDLSAQQSLARMTNNLDFLAIRRAPFPLASNIFETFEHSLTNPLAFAERVFVEAAATGDLHVDLAGATVQGADEGDPTSDGEPTQLVTVSLRDGTDARLRLTVTPSQRWRVNQIAIDGADFDDSGTIFLDRSCGPNRVRVLPGAECPSSDEIISPEIEAEVEELRQQAIDDPSRALEIAQTMQNLIGTNQMSSDEDLCAVVQGTTFAPDDLPEGTRQRAEDLIRDVCPGSIELLIDPPEASEYSNVVGAETVYGQLELSTPELAVETMSELFTNEAFILFYFSLDAEAQRLAARAANLVDVGLVVQPEVLETWDGLGSTEHIDSIPNVFAILLREATATDNHLIDLARLTEPMESTAIEWTNPDGEIVDAHVVEARVAGEETTLHFLLLESQSGRWRLRQVANDPASFEAPANSGLIFLPG